jgi:hypothetical protein
LPRNAPPDRRFEASQTKAEPWSEPDAVQDNAEGDSENDREKNKLILRSSKHRSAHLVLDYGGQHNLRG